MAEFKGSPARVVVTATFTINEDEMAALEALQGYGVDKFLSIFYNELGKAYLGPHEAGMRSLLESVHEQVPQILKRAKDGRKAMEIGADALMEARRPKILETTPDPE